MSCLLVLKEVKFNQDYVDVAVLHFYFTIHACTTKGSNLSNYLI